MAPHFYMIYILIIFGVMVLDRIVKTVIDSGMHVGDSIPVIGDFFSISYIRNTGAAFSMLEGHRTLLILLPAIMIFIAIVFICASRKKYKPIFLVGLSFICGGGLGNLTDRVAYGYVVDMFDFGSFPVFNVADIFVCGGCALMLIYMIIFDNKNPGIREDKLPSRAEVSKPAPKSQKKKIKRLK